MGNDRQVMRDEEVGQSQALLEVFHQVEDLRLHRHVERRGRLVAYQEFRVGRQGPRDRDPLPLPAGEFVREFFAVLRGESHLGKQFGHPCCQRPGIRCQPVRDDGLGDDIPHAPAWVQAGIGVLEDHLHAPPQGRRGGVGHVGAVEQDAASGRGVQADDQPRDSRLAAPRLANQRQGLAATDREGNAVYRAQAAARLAFQHPVQPGARDVELAADVDELEQRLSGHTASTPLR